jgi:hypothetical protein
LSSELILQRKITAHFVELNISVTLTKGGLKK